MGVGVQVVACVRLDKVMSFWRFGPKKKKKCIVK